MTTAVQALAAPRDAELFEILLWAMSHDLPLDEALSASTSKSAGKLARRLSRGEPLGTALRRVLGRRVSRPAAETLDEVSGRQDGLLVLRSLARGQARPRGDMGVGLVYSVI
jgi:hypothetical protein